VYLGAPPTFFLVSADAQKRQGLKLPTSTVAAANCEGGSRGSICIHKGPRWSPWIPLTARHGSWKKTAPKAAAAKGDPRNGAGMHELVANGRNIVGNRNTYVPRTTTHHNVGMFGVIVVRERPCPRHKPCGMGAQRQDAQRQAGFAGIITLAWHGWVYNNGPSARSRAPAAAVRAPPAARRATGVKQANAMLIDVRAHRLCVLSFTANGHFHEHFYCIFLNDDLPGERHWTGPGWILRMSLDSVLSGAALSGPVLSVCVYYLLSTAPLCPFTPQLQGSLQLVSLSTKPT